MQTSGASRGEAADARLESTNALRSLWSEVTTHYRLRHSGMRRQAQASDAQLRIGESRDSGFDAEPVIGPRFARTRWHRPGMTASSLIHSLRGRFINRTVAARQEPQSQPADRENRDQLLDADSADYLDAGGDQHGIGQRGLHRRLRGLLDAGLDLLLAHHVAAGRDQGD